jgi:hypothetical protein
MRYNLKGEVQRDKAKAYLEKLSAKGAQCEIVEKRKPRTQSQNGYYYALIALFAVETGYTKEEAHTLVKRKMGLVYEKNGQKFLKSTAKLDTKEMAAFTEKFRNWSASNGIYLPGPDEYWHNENDYQEIIEKNEATL